MINRFNIIYIICLWCVSSYAQQIEKTSIEVDEEISASLKTSLKNYLQRYLYKDANANAIAAANSFLGSLKFVAHAACRIKSKSGVELVCQVKTKNYIKEVIIENLPMGMLEGELKRKLPVQVGQLIIAKDKSIPEMLEITKSRVETFLRKNGFYGAKTSISLLEDPKSWSVSVKILIEGGSFARVNNVVLEGNSPVSARAVSLTFKRMCFSFNRIFDAFSIGTIDCYSRELEREATKKLQDRLANLGYVQARISLTHRWLDPHDVMVPKECQKKESDDKVPICVDLHVRIDKGPKVRWAINMREGVMVSRSGFSRFFGSIFAVDQLSRITRSLDDEIPPDQIIVKEELEKRINFVDTKNVSESELNESAEQMRLYLVSRGYTNAEVVPAYFVEDSDNIVVNFDIYSGRSYYVKSYKIEPEYLAQYFEPNELDDLVKVRSTLEAGQLSYQKISAALDEIKHRISERGFRDVDGKMEMVSLDDGGIDLTFYITTSKREFIDSILIVNGEDKLNEQIVPFLRNCSVKQGNKPQNKSENLCQGSALDRDNIINDERKLATFYVNNDFLFAEVRSELIEGESGYNLVFYIYDKRFGSEVQQALVRQEIKDVIISGNESVNSSVIKRLFPRANKRQRFDSISLKRGMSSLRESRRFSSIEEKIIVGQENSQDAYFALHVTEKPSLTLDSSLAFSTDQLLSVEMELEEENLFYSMLRLNTNLGLGLFWGRQSSLSNKFVWPTMFGGPFYFSLHAPIIVYDDKSSRAKPFRRLQSKVVAGLEWRASPIVRPYLRYTLAHTLRQDDPPHLNAQERLKTLDGLIPTFREQGKIRGLLNPGISFISLDNPTDPRSGVDTNHWIELSGGPLIGDPFFINLATRNKGYIPLGPLTLALQATIMRAFVEPNEKNWKELSDVSAMVNQGGDRGPRGYQEGAIGISSTRGSIDRFAGYLLNSANIELRIPLTNPELLGNFAGALFVDQAMVLPCTSFSCLQELSFKEILARRGFGFSAGVGLRYNLPVGPISLDYAYAPLHQESRVHLLFGYSF